MLAGSLIGGSINVGAQWRSFPFILDRSIGQYDFYPFEMGVPEPSNYGALISVMDELRSFAVHRSL